MPGSGVPLLPRVARVGHCWGLVRSVTGLDLLLPRVLWVHHRLHTPLALPVVGRCSVAPLCCCFHQRSHCSLGVSLPRAPVAQKGSLLSSRGLMGPIWCCLMTRCSLEGNTVIKCDNSIRFYNPLYNKGIILLCFSTTPSKILATWSVSHIPLIKWLLASRHCTLYGHDFLNTFWCLFVDLRFRGLKRSG